MLDVSDLTIAFPTETSQRTVVDGVSFTLERGKTLGLVGESGSGKSMTALALMALVPPPGRVMRGHIAFDGVDIAGYDDEKMLPFRGRRMAMIFQDPSTALNPVFTVGDQIAEAYRIHHAVGRTQARERAVAAIAEVGIADARLRADAYPHQLSGGMRQRCMIAMALINEPDLLIADEPTTALDVTVQAQILDLIREVQARRNIGMLFISHDLAVVSDIADDIVVMQAGRVVEQASSRQLFQTPREAYTRRLIDAVTLKRAQPRRLMHGTTLIEATGLAKHFPIRAPGLFGRRVGEVQALNGVSFAIRHGETFAIVGESGCGKSTLAKTLLGLHAADAGTLRLDEASVPAKVADRPTAVRRRIQMVFQDPYASLNPRLTAAESIAEPLVIHGIGTDAERRAKCAEAARAVGLDPIDLAKYPHEFSGGERQRIAIARAIVAEPSIILADEPLSSLDVSIQLQILELMQDLKTRFDLTYLLISHDLAVVAHMADTVAVMYQGRIVEQGPADSLFSTPRHPYTGTLIDGAPRLGKKRERVVAIAEPPSALTPPTGCAFHPKCPKSQEICENTRPLLSQVEVNRPGHIAACHFPASW